MRRLTLLLIAISIASYAFYLIAATETFAPYILRDGLIVATLGALLFALNAPPPPSAAPEPNRQNWVLLPLIILTGLAALLRLWRLTELPLGCIGAECDRMSALAEATNPPTLFNLTTGVLYRLTGQNLLSLRLTAALIGVLTVPFFYLTARGWTRPGGALLATALLAVSPWHLWASRTSDPWITVPLLLCLFFWSCANANLSTMHHALRTFGGSLITLALLWQEARSLPWQPDGDNGLTLLTALLHGGGQQASLIFTSQPLPGLLVAALALLGIGYALRYLRRFKFALLLISLIVLAGLTTRLDRTVTLSDSLLLTLLPHLLLFAALALDALFELTQQTWRLLIAPGRVLATGLLVLLLISGRSSLALIRQLDGMASAGQSPAEAALGRYLIEQAQSSADNLILYAPATVLANPATQLMITSAVEMGRVRPLERALDDLLTGNPAGDTLYLLPGEEAGWLGLFGQIFPSAVQESHADEESGQTQFVALFVPATQAESYRGLQGQVFTDDGEPPPLPVAGPLHFTWQDQQTKSGAFLMRWEGALLLPTTGEYGFAMQGADSVAAIATLRLDNALLLDSAQGVTQASVTLPRGFYRIDLEYRNSPAPSGRATRDSQFAPLTIQWQRPGADWETIPRQALRNPAPPITGLLGTYFVGSQWLGQVLDERKDLLITPDLTLPHPYSVRWHGKVAAARSGEYRFLLQVNGAGQLIVDGEWLIDSRPVLEGERPMGEALIYLRQGWHELELLYAPDDAPPLLQLRWQPPGSAEEPLGGAALTPILPGLPAGEAPLPPTPPLLKSSLGDDRFALSEVQEGWRPGARLPPANLAPLPFTRLWQVDNGCGTGEEQLNQPHGVAISAAGGRVYVADTANRRVATLTLNGEPAGSIHNDAFQEPFDLHLAADGAPFLLDALAPWLFRLDPASGGAEPLALNGSFYYPRGLALDAAGNFMVADTGGGRVAILQADGQEVGQFGGRETLLGKGQPVDALWGDGRMWTITAEDGRLWRLDHGGSLTAVQPTNTLNGPHLAELPSGSLFVSDPSRSQVLYYAANGEPRGQLAQPGGWVTPTGIDAVLLSDQVYLAVVDSTLCTLSLWQAAVSALP